MGLVNNQRGGFTTFLNFNGKTAKLVQKVGADKVEHDGISGFVVGIAKKDDEFEGQPVQKVLVRLVDEAGDKFQVEINAQTQFAAELMARLNNADVSQPVLIRGYQLEAGSKITAADGSEAVREHDKTGIGLRQGAEFETLIAPNYGATGEKRPPAPTVIKTDRVTKVQTEVIDKDEAKIMNGELTFELGTLVANRIEALKAQGQSDSHGDDGIGAGDAAAAAAAAMRQRAG